MPIPENVYHEENIIQYVPICPVGFCLLGLLCGNQQPKTTCYSAHVTNGKDMENPNLAKTFWQNSLGYTYFFVSKKNFPLIC